jgi:hypothetical protein
MIFKYLAGDGRARAKKKPRFRHLPSLAGAAAALSGFFVLIQSPTRPDP